ncbi:vanin-like protein 1 [Leptinotarsa decemlineata]|uniref:vanin-like protein 1 n=1 Tax=Leptinotarsa decemlineata TaxID=7539 RepID=UPI003D304F4E
MLSAKYQSLSVLVFHIEKMWCLLIILFALVGTNKTDYIAAVVEHQPEISGYRTLKDNMRYYSAQILNACREYQAQIIVFPEYGLTGFVEDPTNYAFELPEVGEKLTFSKRFLPLYKLVQSAWCGIYVVLNVLEKTTATNKKTIYYNTNIVFNQNSTVVAKYRKVNLYEEPNLTSGDPSQNNATFTTDFGVTFGMFIGFDMLFYNPSRRILDDNASVTDVIISSAWLSTFPFFHSLSFHNGYALANKVNLLVATNHNFTGGIGGSGIYGSDGTVFSYYISEDVEKWNGKVLISAVGNTAKSITSQVSEISSHDPQTTDKKLNSYQAVTYFDSNHYTFKTLDLTQRNISERICAGSFCCTFEIIPSSINIFEVYKLMAHTGSYELGKYTQKNMKICSLLACETSDSSTCGTTIVTMDSKFRSISIKIDSEEVTSSFYQPVTLSSGLIPVFNTTYQESVVNVSRSILFTTNKPQEKVSVFGIYGVSGNTVNTSLTILIVLMATMCLV